MLSITKAKLLLAGAFVCCLLQFNVLSAQNEVDTTFNTRINYVFGRLEKNRVPYGFLRDYAFEFTNLIAFDGVSLIDSNYVDYTTLGDIYNTLITSRIHTSAAGLISPAVWDSLWFSQRQNGIITLSGAFFNYARFADDAVSGGRLTISNDQFVDSYVNGAWQNPYTTRKLLAIAPSTDYYEGKNLKVILPSNLWFTNSASSVSSINVDFNDGLGYRPITMGQALNVNYSGTGRKEWRFRLLLTNGTYLYSHTSVYIKEDPHNGYDPGSMTAARTGTSDPETIGFIASKSYLGKAAYGWITIDYANADRVLRRPLIVAERFDPGHITHPERWYGNTTMEDFRRDVDNSVSTNLINLLGTNINDYDIIYVNWGIGTDYIQRNAYLLQNIIDWVNTNKEPLNGVIQPNVIIGQSMGGLITRWALKDMENAGRNHQTSLFISDDSPQLGANIPLSYQYMYRHANSLYVRTGLYPLYDFVQLIRNRAQPYKQLHITNTPAVRQMLVNYVNDNNQLDNTMHNQWQAELSNMGYPSNYGIRVVAVSNGSECAITQPYSPGSALLNFNGKATTRFLSDMIVSFYALGTGANLFSAFLTGKPAFLLGFLPGRNEIKYQFTANAQPNQATSLLYHGYITYKKTWLWAIPIQVTVTNRSYYASSATLPYDYYPGAEQNDGLDLKSLTVSNWLIKNGATGSHIQTFCFLPVANALDIGGGKVALTNADYLSRYVGATPPPPGPKYTPFINFITAFNVNSPINNEEHLDIHQRNGDWIANELNNTPAAFNCSFICSNNMSITGGSAICSSPVTYTLNNAPTGSGVSIVWSASVSGLVNIAPSSNGSQATVTRSGTGQTGPLTLSAVVSNASCGSVTINSSTVQVGVPTINISALQSGTCSSAGYQTWSLKASSPDAITSWQWTVDNSSSVGWYIDNPNSPSTFVDVPGGSGGGISVTATSSCGTGKNGVTIYSNCPHIAITATPNPTTNNVTIAVADKKETASFNKKKAMMYQIKVTDQLGNVKKQYKYSSGTANTTISLGGLVSGLYTIQAFDGTSWSSTKVIKQ